MKNIKSNNFPQQTSIIVTEEERLQFRLNRTHEERYRRAMQMLRLIKKLHACKKVESKAWSEDAVKNYTK